MACLVGMAGLATALAHPRRTWAFSFSSTTTRIGCHPSMPAQWNAEFEASLNAITYQLYGLTPEEIAMVEGG